MTATSGDDIRAQHMVFMKSGGKKGKEQGKEKGKERGQTKGKETGQEKGKDVGKGVWAPEEEEGYGKGSGWGAPVAYGAPISAGQPGYAVGPGQFGFEAPGQGLGDDPRTPGGWDEHGEWQSPRRWPE